AGDPGQSKRRVTRPHQEGRHDRLVLPADAACAAAGDAHLRVSRVRAPANGRLAGRSPSVLPLGSRPGPNRRRPMSNALTGDYDIVLEIAGDAVDRVLAYLHQQGASDAASPKLLHGLSARVGNLPLDWSLALAEFVLDDYFGPGKIDIHK